MGESHSIVGMYCFLFNALISQWKLRWLPGLCFCNGAEVQLWRHLFGFWFSWGILTGMGLWIIGSSSFPLKAPAQCSLKRVHPFHPTCTLGRVSFSPGPLHHGFFEDLLMMAIQTLVMWALIVVLSLHVSKKRWICVPFHVFFSLTKWW